jgi:hypothetical protein
MLGLFFDPEDGGNTFIRNIGELLPDCTMHFFPSYVLNYFFSLLSSSFLPPAFPLSLIPFTYLFPFSIILFYHTPRLIFPLLSRPFLSYALLNFFLSLLPLSFIPHLIISFMFPFSS